MGYLYDGTNYYKDGKQITKKKYNEGLSEVAAANSITLRIRAGETVEIPKELKDLVNEQLTAWKAADELPPIDDISGEDVLKIVFNEYEITRKEANKLHELVEKAGIKEKDWKGG